MYLDETLRVLPGFEAPHASLPLTRWLMRVFGAVVQVSMLPVDYAGHHHSFRSCVAAQLVGYDHPGTTMIVCPQQLKEESHSRESITLWLNENIDDNAVLINRSPEVMPHTIDLQEHLIEMPLVPGPGTTFSQACRVQVAELVAPAPNAFVADQHPS